MKEYIKRDLYLKKINPYIGKDIIKVIVGQRRVGKSYMLFQIMDRIREIYKNPEIIYINMEDYTFEGIKDYKDLMTFIQKNYSGSDRYYLFIDEVQEIKGFEKALRSLLSAGKYDIYITGSNAQMLSGEIATILAGRSIEIKIYSLSYAEFLTFHNLKDSDEALTLFMKFGGLPYLINLELKDGIIFDYLNNIYATILYRDIVTRYNIRNTQFLERLIRYVADNTGSLISAKRISDFLKSQRTNISPQVVLNYLSYLIDAFFIFKVQRYDIRGRKIFEINEKYYFEDLGLRHSITSFSQGDINKILENLVYTHLLCFGYRVTIGKIKNMEIDFVGKRNQDIIYIQVAYLISSNDVRKREFGNLMEIKDNYRKIVVSMDPITTNREGIEHLHIRDFLNREW